MENETLTTAQTASLLRAALKAAGVPARSVSIRSDVYSMGATIRVRIKDATVSIGKVREIAESFASVRRDESGSILSGGNTFVDVAHTSEVRAELRASAAAAVSEYLSIESGKAAA